MDTYKIESREEYFSLIKNCNEKKKSILAVKSHISKGLDMQIHIVGRTAKFKTIDGENPIAEIGLGDGFIDNSLTPNLDKVEAEMIAIDTAYSLFLLDNV